ncbi:uncharacterized protein MAM_00930 [Metarhizium album ARSEF 1941]|uniref:Uncharacterized protein n=1 Tax=Metarhizium album (strain ARSEF 1941) TaxID=1081103 RepID=A0A0B2X6B2_METAS|nr:uncharacterized protein MAM_00930 [Metarhizium album ARSEF 1941]KHO01929.1 hypothetical protein MAM_00930 [Metarhizium album ARSEF 1941]
MKFSAGVVFTAALATALPQYNNRGGGSKLPWVGYSRENDLSNDCLYEHGKMFGEKDQPSAQVSQEARGYLKNKYGYEDEQQCLNDREPKPSNNQGQQAGGKLPWVGYSRENDLSNDCLYEHGKMFGEKDQPSAQDIERLCGTSNFCSAFTPDEKYVSQEARGYLKNKYGYEDEQQCLNDRESKPSNNQGQQENTSNGREGQSSNNNQGQQGNAGANPWNNDQRQSSNDNQGQQGTGWANPWNNDQGQSSGGNQGHQGNGWADLWNIGQSQSSNDNQGHQGNAGANPWNNDQRQSSNDNQGQQGNGWANPWSNDQRQSYNNQGQQGNGWNDFEGQSSNNYPAQQGGNWWRAK